MHNKRAPADYTKIKPPIITAKYLRIVVAFAVLIAAGTVTPAAQAEEFRPIDGSGNNLQDPLQGSAGQELRRNLDANFQYRDELWEQFPPQRRRSRPAPIRSPIRAQFQTSSPTSDNPPKSDRTNLLETFFGQFVNHDKEDTRASNTEFFRVSVESTADPLYDPTKPGVLVGVSEPIDDGATRSVVNNATSWLDLSTVYGTARR